ncbi:hypothetical protein [Marinimicrobium alkaliphilum]|uniref:hypothetical protein n=1 Tax=Marinimicrobium alkaliphilum TaxID=2202654 RepID=UPI000DB9BD2E|nr:hypothetical protein [Marinimicrobium alkaliphilum]
MDTHANASEDLAFIREIMADTRQAAGISGGYFVLWGLVVGVGLVATWLQVIGVLPYQPMLTWGTCLGLGAVGNILMMWRDFRRPVNSRAGRLVGTVWMGLFVTQMIFIVAHLGFNTLPGEHMPGIFSSLLGTGIFITGVLAGMPWLRNMALAWWLGAFAMFAWPGDYVSLLMGGLLLLFYVVPGLVLIKQQRAQAASEV